MKYLSYLVFISFFAFSFTSCNEKEETDKEWKNANDDAYDKIVNDINNEGWTEIVTPAGVDKGVYYREIRKGTGTEKPLQTALVKVLYSAAFYDGTVFDSNMKVYTFQNVQTLPDKGEQNVIYIVWNEDKYTLCNWLEGAQRFEEVNYLIGTSMLVNGEAVVRGLSIALMNMQIGDRWEVCIPYDLGYGRSGKTLDAYSTLFYEIQLLEINQYP